MPRPMESACTSSLRYVIATAGSPLSVRPSTVRSASKAGQLGAAAMSKVSSAEQSIDAAMIPLRPRASETAPANSSATPITPVGSESESALPASLTPYCRLNSGISGCTQYKRPNVATPTANNARLVRRNAGVPCRMNSPGAAITAARTAGSPAGVDRASRAPAPGHRKRRDFPRRPRARAESRARNRSKWRSKRDWRC
jgi:hypothetical protein